MDQNSFLIDDDDRYARLRLIAWWDQARLRASRVMVVGAGALGNEVLKNLALVGIGCVYIADFDTIERSNLTRSVLFRRSDCGRSKSEAAAAAVQDLNEDTRAVPLTGDVLTDVGLGLFRDVDVVIGCLDNREARWWVNRQCWKTSTPWIDGGIQEINGVVKVFMPPASACYECGLTENDYRLMNLRYSCPLLRQEDLQAGKVPTAPTIASMIAALQVQEALKILHGMPVKAGTAMVYNGAGNQFYTTAYQRREDCLAHETYDQIHSVPVSAAEDTARALLAEARRWSEDDQPLRLLLDRDLVLALECAPCGISRRVMQPLSRVGTRQAHCPKCDQISKPRLEHIVSEESPLAAERLIDLGIPAYDIVRVETSSGRCLPLLLAGDRHRFDPTPGSEAAR